VHSPTPVEPRRGGEKGSGYSFKNEGGKKENQISRYFEKKIKKASFKEKKGGGGGGCCVFIVLKKGRHTSFTSEKGEKRKGFEHRECPMKKEEERRIFRVPKGKGGGKKKKKTTQLLFAATPIRETKKKEEKRNKPIVTASGRREKSFRLVQIVSCSGEGERKKREKGNRLFL